MNISYALTAAFGGLLSVLQGFDLGGLVVYLNYSKQVGQPLNQISQQMTTLLSALAGAERIFDVMDTKPEVDEGTVTLIEVEKDANGTLSPFNGKGHSHTWAWKTPRTSGMALVPVLAEGDVLTELGQAVREKTGLKLLLPGEDSPDGIWVRVAVTAPSSKYRIWPLWPATAGPGNTRTTTTMPPSILSGGRSEMSLGRTTISLS